jgi:hypothetical protein
MQRRGQGFLRGRWLVWPFEVPHLGILMAASPLLELAFEMQYWVYIVGEVVGAVLLPWDFAQLRWPGSP